MVIIGFDPGLTNTGYAVLRKKNNDISLIECGLINPKKSKIISERLYTIFSQTSDLIKKFNNIIELKHQIRKDIKQAK